MIITLCGSTKFEKEFHQWNLALTLSGHVVFTLSAFPSQHANREWYTEDQKKLLDEAHLKKIDVSEAIFFINKFAYIGTSGLKEYEYAQRKGKLIFFLESWGKDIGVSDTDHCRDMIEQCYERTGLWKTSSPVATCNHYGPWGSILKPEGRKVVTNA